MIDSAIMAAVASLLFILFIVLFSHVTNSSYTEEDDVLVLNEENFDQAVAEFQSLMVEFYAPWCGHCKALAPEYANVARLVKTEMKDVRLAKVDATVETKLARKYEVKGYPTIKFFHEGNIMEYTSGRNTHDFITFLKKKVGPIVHTVDTVEAARAIEHSEDLVIFGFFQDMSGPLARAFLEVAADNDDILFAVSSNAEVLKEYGVEGANTVVAFKRFDDARAELKGEMTVDKIKEFILENNLPLVNEYNAESAQKLFGGDIKKHLILFISKKSADFEKSIKALKEAAESFKGKVVFIYMGIDDDENSRILEFFGLKVSDCPTVRFINLVEDLIKYKPDTNDLSAATLKQFTQSCLDGKQKPHLLTDKLPEDWDAKPVKILVGTNFESVALDKSKNVYVMFYAPWCGHCKTLAPIWDELGKTFENRSDVVIAKMDATTNELSDTKIESFPTIRLYLHDDNTMIDYGGDRTLEGLVKFVERERCTIIMTRKRGMGVRHVLMMSYSDILHVQILINCLCVLNSLNTSFL